MSSSSRVFFALVLIAGPGLLGAQESNQTDTTRAAPVVQTDNRPTIAVREFEYGAVSPSMATDRRTRDQLRKMGVKDGNNFAQALGNGVTAMLIERLVKTGEFHVYERVDLSAVVQEQSIARGVAEEAGGAAIPTSVPSAHYVVTGSVSGLGLDESNFGGIFGGVSSLAGLGIKRAVTRVKLTARVIDSRTGEIIGSFSDEGVSTKGGGVKVGGLFTHGLGYIDFTNERFRETAIGEATDRAVELIFDRIRSMQPTMSAGR
jgi:curli biogenesis system outer membrane secretion channel CsgG